MTEGDTEKRCFVWTRNGRIIILQSEEVSLFLQYEKQEWYGFADSPLTVKAFLTARHFQAARSVGTTLCLTALPRSVSSVASTCETTTAT